MDTVMSLANKYHDPSLIDKLDHVYLLFGDGELCTTKAKELFGKRNLHQLRPPILAKEIAFTFPYKIRDYSCIIIADPRIADRIIRLMVEYVSERVKIYENTWGKFYETIEKKGIK